MPRSTPAIRRRAAAAVETSSTLPARRSATPSRRARARSSGQRARARRSRAREPRPPRSSAHSPRAPSSRAALLARAAAHARTLCSASRRRPHRRPGRRRASPSRCSRLGSARTAARLVAGARPRYAPDRDAAQDAARGGERSAPGARAARRGAGGAAPRAHAWRRAERARRALEARAIYAPLANRLGVWQLKWELEDLAFRYLEPDEYRRIAAALNERRADRERYIEALCAGAARAAAERRASRREVHGRPKHIYSIYRKMQRKQLAFEQLFDVRAVRVVVGSIARLLCGARHGARPLALHPGGVR